MNAGTTYPPYYADEEEDDYYDEPEIVFDNNLHGQAIESFQTGSFYRNANDVQPRSGYTSTFRPDRPFSEGFSYALPAQTMTGDATGEWFRPSGRSLNAEAVYAYSADEPLHQPGQTNLFMEQVRRLGDELFQTHRVGLVVMLAIICLLVCGGLTWLNTFGRGDSEGVIYRFSSTVSHNTTGLTNNDQPAETKPLGNPPAAAPGAHAVSGIPTVNADKIAQVLKQYNSPAAASSQVIYDLGVKYGIDPAYALAFFIHESSAGTKGIAVTTKSLGNIRQTTNSGFEGYQGFRKYPSWEVGAEDWYKLIRNLYIDGWNLPTVEKIIPKYAPSEDNNNPASYINAVNTLVDSWRSGK